MSFWLGLGLQNIFNANWFNIDFFHDIVTGLLVFILVLVGYNLRFLRQNKFIWARYYEDFRVEFLWTCLPVLVLGVVGVPSLILLYEYETDSCSDINIKVTAHQWYWSYEISNFSNACFDSYIVPLEDMRWGDFRLLTVDNKLVLPISIYTQFIVTSSDVLHSWALPSFSLKVDANPGRINITFGSPRQVGWFFGQCSEICGANHSFIPICIEVTLFQAFKTWLRKI